MASSSQSNTLAGPSCTIISSTTAERLTMPESGARFPFRAASPPVSENGFSTGRITSGFLFTEPSIFSPTVFPVQVRQLRCSRSFFVSSFMTA